MAGGHFFGFTNWSYTTRQSDEGGHTSNWCLACFFNKQLWPATSSASILRLQRTIRGVPILADHLASWLRVRVMMKTFPVFIPLASLPCFISLCFIFPIKYKSACMLLGRIWVTFLLRIGLVYRFGWSCVRSVRVLKVKVVTKKNLSRNKSVHFCTKILLANLIMEKWMIDKSQRSVREVCITLFSCWCA